MARALRQMCSPNALGSVLNLWAAQEAINLDWNISAALSGVWMIRDFWLSFMSNILCLSCGIDENHPESTE